MISKTDKILLAKMIEEREVRKRLNPLKYIEPLPYQEEFLYSDHPNLAVVGGNRSGKSLMTALKTLRYLQENPNSKAVMVTHAELSKRVQQPNVNQLLPWKDIQWATYNPKKGFVHRLVKFLNGSELRFMSYEQGAENMQGFSANIMVLDEVAPEDVYKEALMRVADVGGMIIRSFTPVQGIDWNYDDIILNNEGRVKFWFWDSLLNTHIDQESMKRVFESMSPKEREMRQKGAWISLADGLAYETFDLEKHVVDHDVIPTDGKPLNVMCDFNAKLMAWSVGVEQGGVDYIFDTIEIRDSANTQTMCDLLRQKYPNRTFTFYVDIAGGQRSSSTSLTDHSIIKGNFPNAKMFYRKPLHVKDRILATNARLMDGAGRIHVYVNKRCTTLIKDFQQVTYDLLGHDTRKQGYLSHAADAVSYYFFNKYPMDYTSVQIQVRK